MTTEIKTTAAQQPNNSLEHQDLDIFVGKWTTEGETYEWMPGEFFLIHTLESIRRLRLQGNGNHRL